MSNYSLIILKNPDLLQSIRDYFYQSLMQYGFDSTITSEEHKIDSALNSITTPYAVIIQEGMLFIDNFEPPEPDGYDLIGHILDRKEEYYQVHQQHFILNVDKWKRIRSPSFRKQAPNVFSDGKPIQEINIYNVIGELLLSKEIRNSNPVRIDISYLESNVYFLHIKLNEETRVIKIIKKQALQKAINTK